MKILELTKKYVNDEVSQKRITAYIMREIMGCRNKEIYSETKIKGNKVSYYIESITDYEKLISISVIEDINIIKSKLERIKQLDREIRSKEKQLTYVEVPSLSEPNIVYRFYNDGREEKIKKRPKKDA